MKHALPVLVLSLALLSCERDHGGDPLVTPPDAPGDESPDTGPGPGAGNPLEPDQRIECEETGTTAFYSAMNGQELYRTATAVAYWEGDGVPSGAPWLCYKPTGEDCDPGVATLRCAVVTGAPPVQRCIMSLWNLDTDGRYYVFCGIRQESDPDGDGVYAVSNDTISKADYVGVVVQ